MPKSNDRQLFDKTSVAVLVAALAAIGLTGLIVTTAPRDVSDLISR